MGTYYTYSELYITEFVQWNGRCGPFGHAVVRVDSDCNRTEKRVCHNIWRVRTTAGSCLWSVWTTGAGFAHWWSRTGLVSSMQNAEGLIVMLWWCRRKESKPYPSLSHHLLSLPFRTHALIYSHASTQTHTQSGRQRHRVHADLFAGRLRQLGTQLSW